MLLLWVVYLGLVVVGEIFVDFRWFFGGFVVLEEREWFYIKFNDEDLFVVLCKLVYCILS